MRLLIVSQYFFPENFRVNDLVTGLVQRGHSVTVVTGQPNYPGGKFFDGYGWSGPSEEVLLGAKVLRVPMLPRGSGNALRLILNYFSFAFFATWAVMFRLREQFDAIFIFQVSPVTVGIPGCVAGWKFRAPILMWVLDLWPESLRATGAVRSPGALALVGKMVAAIYRRCARILVQSRAFFSSIQQHGFPVERISYFPNWIEAEYLNADGRVANLDSELPKGFRIVYAGNIGAAQGFREIIDAAELVARELPEVLWVVAGDGRLAAWVKVEIARRGLMRHFHFTGQLPPSTMPSLFACADTLLVSLRPDPVFEMTIPGKVQSYLAAGKPILAMIDGEGARVVREAEAGFTCAAGDAAGLAEIVIRMYRESSDLRNIMGQAGRRYAFSEFEREHLFDCLETWLREEVAKPQ